MKTKEAPVFGARDQAWKIVIGAMEDQLKFLPPELADRAIEIRKFLTAAAQSRYGAIGSTAGITLERDGHHQFASIWISAVGRDRPISLVTLPVSMALRAANKAYVGTLTPITDERDRMIEEDEWL